MLMAKGRLFVKRPLVREYLAPVTDKFTTWEDSAIRPKLVPVCLSNERFPGFNMHIWFLPSYIVQETNSGAVLHKD